MRSFEDYDKEFGFYGECNKKLLGCFEKYFYNMIYILKIYFD